MGATPPRPPRRKTEAERAKDIFEARTAPSPGPEPSRDNGPDLITWAGVGHLLGIW